MPVLPYPPSLYICLSSVLYTLRLFQMTHRTRVVISVNVDVPRGVTAVGSSYVLEQLRETKKACLTSLKKKQHLC